MPKRTLMSWSTGKDSAWTVWKILHNPEYDLCGLFCTINQQFSRTAMHGVRVQLLKIQAEKMGLPVDIIEIPFPCSNLEYEAIMEQYIHGLEQRNIDCFGFGDLYLEDIRDYRIEKLKDSGIEPIFPVWDQDTIKVSKQIVESGIKAVITCVDPKQLDGTYAGRFYDQDLLDCLPPKVDPCGENGEFHTFVYDAPMFASPIPISTGDVVNRDGFVFADVVLKQ